MDLPLAQAIHPFAIRKTVNGMVNGFLARLLLLIGGGGVFLIFRRTALGIRRGVESFAVGRSEFPSAVLQTVAEALTGDDMLEPRPIGAVTIARAKD